MRSSFMFFGAGALLFHSLGCMPEFATETSGEGGNDNQSTTLSETSTTGSTTTSSSTETETTTTTSTTTTTTTTADQNGAECGSNDSHCSSDQVCCIASNSSSCSNSSCGDGYVEVSCYASSECGNQTCCLDFSTSAYIQSCNTSCSDTSNATACLSVNDCGSSSASCISWYSVNGIELGYCDNCCEANGGLGCWNDTISECVCDSDSYCCETSWDSVCAGEVESLGCGTCAG